MYLADTIVAPATPVGESALALVRLSGPAAAGLAAACHSGEPPLPRHAWHGDYHDRHGRLIDDVVFCFFQGPNSYTGEDVLEISCHGNALIVSKIMEDLVGRGCRVAEPGEFTKRAFLNGRLDLTEAEAVMDLIHARSERALEAAQRQLRGALRERIDAMVSRLLDLSADVEAHVDFPEEDLPTAELGAWREATMAIARDLRAWAATRQEGERLRDGVRVVLFGEPNAGKSSLLNRLVGFERAIVSDEPGTTRDFLEERLALDGWSIRIFDTAGLREPRSAVERAGVERTIAQAREADVLVLVADATRPMLAMPSEMQSLLESRPMLVAQNKSDLPQRVFRPTPPLRVHDVVEVSARTGFGFDAFRERLSARIRELSSGVSHDEVIAVNARHEAGLLQAAEALDRAATALGGRTQVDLVAIDLRAAVDALGQIVGRIDHEEVLDRLFARFCIGK